MHRPSVRWNTQIGSPNRYAANQTHHTESIPMNIPRLAAILLIAAGALALVYGSFSYTKQTSAVKIGSLELSVQEKETVNVPVWAGIAAIVAGGLLLAWGSKGR